MSSGRECALSELVSDSQADLQALWKASFTALIEADEDAFYSDAESRLARSLNQVQFYLTDSSIVFYLSPASLPLRQQVRCPLKLHIRFKEKA